MLNDIKFNRNASGLGQALTGKDHISAFAFYSNTYPTGFSVTNPIKKIFSLKDAENLGIVNTYTDEVKATGGNVLISTKGAVGDTENILLDGSIIGSVIVPSIAFTDVASEATAIKAAINYNTVKHGIVATGTTGNIILTLPLGFGKSVSAAGKLSFSSVSSSGGIGTGVATVTQFTAGTASLYAVWHYHIAEYFRLQPQGVLYLGIFPVAAYTGIEIQTIQNFANGEIRQLAVFLSVAFSTSQIIASQAYATILQAAHRPLSVFLTADFTGSSLGSLPDISNLNSKNVTVIIGTEGKFLMPNYSITASNNIGDKVIWGGGCYICTRSGSGNPIWDTSAWVKTVDNYRIQSGYSISNLGAELGAWSFSKVNESTAWVQKYNFSDGINLDDIGFVTGELFQNVPDALLSTLNDYHYVFLRKITDVNGSYNNDTWTSVTTLNDYCYVEKNRTMDKAERNVYASVIPLLNSPLYVNTDGTLSQATLAVFENAANVPLGQMEIDGELSGFKVLIDPTQNIISTSKFVLTIKNIPVGVARNIEINSGFTTKIS